MRVLVIDDERSFLKATARVLGRSHEVATAHTAEEALAHLAEEHFDAILCDYHLRGTDGAELLSELPPATAERVVFMTGGAWAESDRAFLKNRRVLLKPFAPEELLAALEAVAQATASASPPAIAIEPRPRL